MLQIGTIVITSSGQFQLLQIGTTSLQIGAELLQIGAIITNWCRRKIVKVYFKYGIKSSVCQMCLLMYFGY